MDRNERVAALHDGRLSPDDRDELLNELFADEFESDVFAETAAVLRELEEAHAAKAPAGGAVVPGEPPPPDTDAHDGVIPLASRRPAGPLAGTETEDAAEREDGVIPLHARRPAPSRRWLAYGALAAGIAGLALAASLLSNRGGDTRFDDPAAAIAMLEGGAGRGLAAGWDDPWQSTRGAINGNRDRLTVHIGASMVDVEIAAAARDPSLGSLAETVATLLGDTTLNGAAAAASSYTKVAQRANGAPEDVRALLADGREAVRAVLDPEWLELGIWAETARTAAVRHDAGFFRSRDSRATLERIEMLPLDVRAADALARVRSTLPVDDSADWVALEEHLSDLLRSAGR